MFQHCWLALLALVCFQEGNCMLPGGQSCSIVSASGIAYEVLNTTYVDKQTAADMCQSMSMELPYFSSASELTSFVNAVKVNQPTSNHFWIGIHYGGPEPNNSSLWVTDTTGSSLAWNIFTADGGAYAAINEPNPQRSHSYDYPGTCAFVKVWAKASATRCDNEHAATVCKCPSPGTATTIFKVCPDGYQLLRHVQPPLATETLQCTLFDIPSCVTQCYWSAIGESAGGTSTATRAGLRNRGDCGSYTNQDSDSTNYNVDVIGNDAHYYNAAGATWIEGGYATYINGLNYSIEGNADQKRCCLSKLYKVKPGSCGYSGGSSPAFTGYYRWKNTIPTEPIKRPEIFINTTSTAVQDMANLPVGTNNPIRSNPIVRQLGFNDGGAYDYTIHLCDTEIDPSSVCNLCGSSPCQNNGVCLDEGNGPFQRDCASSNPLPAVYDANGDGQEVTNFVCNVWRIPPPLGAFQDVFYYVKQSENCPVINGQQTTLTAWLAGIELPVIDNVAPTQLASGNDCQGQRYAIIDFKDIQGNWGVSGIGEAAQAGFPLKICGKAGYNAMGTGGSGNFIAIKIEFADVKYGNIGGSSEYFGVGWKCQ